MRTTTSVLLVCTLVTGYAYASASLEGSANTRSAAGSSSAPVKTATDTTPPVSHVYIRPAADTSAVLYIGFEATDDQSGVDYAEFYYRKDGGAWTRFPGSFAGFPIVFDTTKLGGDGYYEFYTLAVDKAGNKESPPALPDTTILVLTHSPGSRIYVNVSAQGPQSGESWENAIRQIQAAVVIAAKFNIHEIWVAGGTYAEYVMVSSFVDLDFYGGFAGTETSISERNASAHPTIVDASVCVDSRNLWTYTALYLQSLTNCRVDGFTATGSTTGIACAILDAATRVSNCTATANTLWGIICFQNLGTLENCTSSNNGGGGVSVSDVPDSATTTSKFIRCTIANNVVDTSHSGGGIFCSEGRPLFKDCTIEHNVAFDGGGAFCDSGQLEFDHCTIRDNNALGNGGGIGGSSRSDTTPRVILNRCDVSDNTAGYGGGISLTFSCGLEAVNCVISGNTAGSIGGALNATATEATRLVNCTIANNSAGSYGGGIVFAKPTLEAPRITILNTIFQGNAKSAVCVATPQADPVLTYCLFHGNPNGDYRAYPGASYTGAHALELNVPDAAHLVDGDALFVDATAGHYELLEGSSAIDAGSSEGAPAMDRRGVSRPTGARVDIGAYEFKAPVFCDVDGDCDLDASDIQRVINAALGIVIDPACDIDKSGEVDAVDVQTVINAALGFA